jgi:hypothetical protein
VLAALAAICLFIALVCFASIAAAAPAHSATANAKAVLSRISKMIRAIGPATSALA